MALSGLLGEAKRRRGLRALLEQARAARSPGPPLAWAANLVGVPESSFRSMPDGTWQAPYLGPYVDPVWGGPYMWRYHAVLYRGEDGRWVLVTHLGQHVLNGEAR
jgi:hypothetical protein